MLFLQLESVGWPVDRLDTHPVDVCHGDLSTRLFSAMIDFFGVAALVSLTCFGGTVEECEGKPSNMTTLVPEWAHGLDNTKSQGKKADS